MPLQILRGMNPQRSTREFISRLCKLENPSITPVVERTDRRMNERTNERASLRESETSGIKAMQRPRIDYAAAVCTFVFALVYVYFTMDSLQRASITGQRLTETSSSLAMFGPVP